MSKTLIIIYLSLLAPSLMYTQNHELYYEGGVILSISNSVINKEIYELDNGSMTYEKPILKTKEQYFHTFSFGFSYSGKIIFSENKIELRPGIIFGDSYTGLEIGLFYRRLISGNVYGIIGLNVHYNVRFSSGNMSSYATEDGFFYNPSIGFGVNIIKSISLSLIYEYVGDKRIYSDYYFNPHGPSARGYRNLLSVIKLNIEV